ncbi:type I-U CRISPR-associated RAMP protein Csb1/Cas7u [Actinomyces marmotae]|uniref:type I-G CRISPR-associated RAMP protein Csb1/Cas7g n=1 Tax=Actinomyces marmotae TaxID=2737173 RepID=UPI001F403962|nr:type I-U CRISPR-associated RAMP protein Csb1/Cas7u [Actinomyces marmotae]
MTTATEFRATLQTLIDAPNVAGISLTGQYESLIGRTVTPPAGTIRAGGEVVGIFTTEDGKDAATIDTWGSVASRCEVLLAGPFRGNALADHLGYPLVTFIDEEGKVLTTSVALSHRQADATWRLARNELIEAGIDFDGIRDGSRKNADALIVGFPTAIPFGWWHSHTVRSEKVAKKKGAEKAKKNDKDALGDVLDDYLGHYVMDPVASRSARLFTAEIIAIGVRERRRMAGKTDPLFSAVGKDTTIGDAKLSEVGLGSLPPGVRAESESPSDLTYESIESRAFLSLMGLRSFGFDKADGGAARVLSAALPLLLYTLLQENLALRAGTELCLLSPLTAEVVRQGAGREPLELPDVETLAELVREIGAEIGWAGPREVTIRPESPLGKVLNLVAGAE